MLFLLEDTLSEKEYTFDLMRASKIYTFVFADIMLALDQYGNLGNFLKTLLYLKKLYLILQNTDFL